MTTAKAAVMTVKAPRNPHPDPPRAGKPSLLLLVVLLLVAAGCADEPGPEPLGTYGLDASRAEVTAFATWPAAVELRDPAVLYGGAATEGGTKTDFEAPGQAPLQPPLFRVSDLLPRPEGGIYVANAGAHEILAIDGEGALLWRAGRAGEGPGEFRALSKLQAWRADSLVAIDQRRNVASFWSASGGLGRTRTAGSLAVDPSPELAVALPASLLGVLADGRLVVLGPGRAFREGEPGWRRVRTALTVVAPDGVVTAPVELPGPRLYELRTPGRLPVVLAPMTGGLAVAVAADRLVWARADRHDVIFLDPGRTVHRILRVEAPLEPVTPSVRRAYLETWRPWFPVEEPIPFPSEIPAFDRVFFSASGDVWARRYDWSGRREEWVRFAGTSGEADRFRFPERVRIMAATSNAAYGIRRDELDVECLVRVPLR